MSYGITLKAFANSSPGFALKPWVQKTRKRFLATLKELRLLSGRESRRNSFRVASSKNECIFPRVAKAQPWAGISERFQRYSSHLEFSHSLGSDRVSSIIASVRVDPVATAPSSDKLEGIS